MATAARPQLLDNVAEIDAAWLTSILVHRGYKNAIVESFEARPIGTGNVSDTVRVQMRFASPTSAPESLVCKFRCSNPVAHAHGISSGSYLREVGSYSILDSADVTCRVPSLFWVDGGAENINLVVEDLCDTARPGDQIAGCSITDAASVVEELAKLHRAFFPLPRKAAPSWVMTMAETSDYWVNAISCALPIIRERAADHLSAEEMAVVESASKMAGIWYNLPVTRAALTHGDPRVDNILFENPDQGVRAVLIDWQMTGWRNPMHDLAYFLSGSVTIEDRRASEDAFLSHYAAIFAEKGDYSVPHIREDYRLQLPAGLMTTVAAYAVLQLNPAVDDLLMALLRRNIAAVRDWKSFDAIAAVS